jgi:hypothetical protein
VQVIMDLYPTLLEAGALGRDDTRRMAQAIHTLTRQNRKADAMLPFIQQMVTDLRRGALEPHPYAFVHLLGIFKEYRRFNEGHELWQWLVQQGETHVSQAAYGAAIELMAYGGVATLPELEDLYSDALKRFPGTFAEYHLSPDAIIPDRSRPVLFSGVPTVLFQGIFTARMLAGEWKKAYLALDTILRLYPTQTPPRFFELVMTNRPIAEAYSVFMVACRAGTVLNPGQVTALLTKLKAAMGTSPSMSVRMMLLRAVANALYAYQEAGGRLGGLHVGVFVHCFEHMLPEQAPGEDFQGESAHLRNMLVLAAHEMLAGLLQAGFDFQVYPFEALISLAGNMRVPDLLTTAMKDINAAQIELGPIGTRSALTSAGLLKHKELVEQLWTGIVSNADAQGSMIAFEDWITFTKACRRCDMADYFHEQLAKLPHTTTANVEQQLVYQMSLTDKVPNHSYFEHMSVEQLTGELEGLKQQMKNVEAVLMSSSPLDLEKSPFYMHLDPAATSLGSLEDLRAVYDELTTDPHQPPPPPPPPTAEDSPDPPSLSSTKIPFDQLRFMNWLSILEIMDKAEAWELHRRSLVDEAIRDGRPYKDRPLASLLRTPKKEPIQTKEDLLERIRKLRNPSIVSSSVFRKVHHRVPIRRIVDAEPAPEPQDEEPKEFKGKATMRYYVGLEPGQRAPANKKDTRGRRDMDAGSSSDSFSGEQSAGEKPL